MVCPSEYSMTFFISNTECHRTTLAAVKNTDIVATACADLGSEAGARYRMLC
jgi:hypothetical protein